MSLFGKILAFLNVLGVAGVMALGVMTYAKKTTWAAAVGQQDLRDTGLPLTPDEIDSEGYRRSDNLGEEIMKGIIPMPQVRTQVEEVERVRVLVDKKLEAVADPPGKLLLLVDVLEPFTTEHNRYTSLQLIRRWMRENMRAKLKDQLSLAAMSADAQLKQIADTPDETKRDRIARTWDEAFLEFASISGGAKTPFVLAIIKARAEAKDAGFEAHYRTALAQIQKRLEAELEAIYSAAAFGKLVDLDTNETVQCSVPMQKYYVVRYLYNIAPFLDVTEAKAGDWASDAVKRVVAIVGLEAFPAVLIEQAVRIGTLTEQLKSENNLSTTVSSEIAKQIDRQRSEFTGQHNRMIDYLRQQAGIINDREGRLVRATRTADNHEKIRDESKKINEGMEKDLAESRLETAEVVKDIRSMTADLLEIRLKTRDAARLNQNLEQEIRKQERYNR